MALLQQRECRMGHGRERGTLWSPREGTSYSRSRAAIAPGIFPIVSPRRSRISPLWTMRSPVLRRKVRNFAEGCGNVSGLVSHQTHQGFQPFGLRDVVV